MDHFSAVEIGTLCAIIGTAFAGVAKVFYDGVVAKQRGRLDHLQVAIEQNRELMKDDRDHEKEVQKLLVENTRLETRCEHLQDEVRYLREKLMTCGKMFVNPPVMIEQLTEEIKKTTTTTKKEEGDVKC